MQKFIKILQKTLILKSFKDFSKSISVRKFTFWERKFIRKRNRNKSKMEREFEFLKTKFKISEQTFPVKFMRLMPPSFPTIRFSQLAMLYHLQPNLFSKILKAKNIQELKSLLKK